MNPPDIASQEGVADPSPCRRVRFVSFLRDHFGWMLSIFLIGLGAKLFLILKCGTPLPFWDQWYGEAEFLYAPYFEGRLSLPLLLRAHNEHRILFTRIYDLILLLLNGQWDNQLQMVANAFFHSAILAGFGGLLARLIGKAIWPFIWLPLVLALVLPFAWENTLWGFQSQFYFLLLFSLLTIWLLGLSKPLSAKWWLGVMVAVGSLFTTASGFLASDAVVALILLDLLKHRKNWRRNFPTLAFCLAITTAGFMLKKDVPIHHVLQAHSVGDFIISLGNNLAWPWIVLPVYAPCNLFPLILLGWIYLKSNEDQMPGERLVLGIGFWVSAQAAAAAYGRGAGGSLPYWRYMDSSSFIMIANCAAIGLLLIRYRVRLRPARLWYSGFLLWAISCLAGLGLLSNHAWQIDIPESKLVQQMQLKTTRAFLATDDPGVLLNKPGVYILMPANVTNEVALLRNPHIRSLLPACVRAPLKVVFQNDGPEHSSSNCAPAIKNQPSEPVWGFCPAPNSTSARRLESLPVQKSALPFLEFPVAGELGGPGLSLDLVELPTGRKISVTQDTSAGGRWISAYARAPKGEFKIVARDENPAGWFAFRQPRELGRLSYWAIQILRAWKYFLAAGVVCFLLSAVWLAAYRPGTHPKAD